MSSRSPAKLRWRPPPPPLPPSPKILHFPIGRRARRAKRLVRHPQRKYPKCLQFSFGKRESLGTSSDENISDKERGETAAVEDVERWRFHGRLMRTECNFFTMERHFALKRLEKNGVKFERTLRSTVETVFNSRLEKLGELSYLQQLQESRLYKPKARFSDVRSVLTKKNGRQKIEEFSKRIEATECSSDRPLFQENMCSGHCRALVQRIVEQVRAETEQWTQMQNIVAKVKREIEQLQHSHDYWETRANASGKEVHFLRLAVDQWREKAVCHENKVKRLEYELQLLKEKLLTAPGVETKQQQQQQHKVKRNATEKLKRHKENHEALRGTNQKAGASVRETGMQIAPTRMVFRDIGNLKALR